ncbi:MAG: hypothetical protein WDZ80_04520 [Candidatus Paceibacterota bacterium]
MDKETLTNHITRLGKDYFEVACRIVLKDIFHLQIVNVDGKGDGGTDYSSFKKDGSKSLAAYQITTQKSSIKNKAFKDAEKAINKLNADRYYFFTSLNVDETDSRKIENEIAETLKIQSTFLSAQHVAGLLLSEKLVNKFLDETNSPLPRDYSPESVDYMEMALHSLTLISNDVSVMKEGIYDDTILFVLSNTGAIEEDEIIKNTNQFLSLTENGNEKIKKRIGALFGQEKIVKTTNKLITLSQDAEDDIIARKRIYNKEFNSLISAQVDLMQDEHNIDWDEEDAKKVSVWVARAYINEQISNLKNIKAGVVSNPIFENNEDYVSKIKSYLLNKKGLPAEDINEATKNLLDLAADHPLINKIARASIYVALEGSNPISSAKSLGANRWSDFSILIEPTVAIPAICKNLYKGNVNNLFDLSVYSIKNARELDAKLYIPYFYVNECAGHLLQARKYDVFEEEIEELQYSNNAFVANYCALKLNDKVKLPETFMKYLCTFSPAIKTERHSTKKWVRAIMTDLQSILNREGINFVKTPNFNHENTVEFETAYSHFLHENRINKPTHLINHDVWALQFTNDDIIENGSHWIILTYDKSLISVSRTSDFRGWIANPSNFLDLTEGSKPLSESKLISIIHSVATYSEQTLSVAARILDRIVYYASDEIQNWEFKEDVRKFKEELIDNIDLNSDDYNLDVDRKTDEFLKSKGIKVGKKEDADYDLETN